jgi:hypothetical protein
LGNCFVLLRAGKAGRRNGSARQGVRSAVKTVRVRHSGSTRGSSMRQFSKWRFFRRAKPVLLVVGGCLARVFSARWVPAARVSQKRGATLERPCYPRAGCAEQYEGVWWCWHLVVGCVLSESEHDYWLWLWSARDWVVRKNIFVSWESPVGLYGARPGYLWFL